MNPVTIRGVWYRSEAAAARALNVSGFAIGQARRLGTLDNVGNGSGSAQRRKIKVDGKEYESQTAASLANNINRMTLNGACYKARKNNRAKFKCAGHEVELI